jgi:hypothetical protein
MIEIDWGAHEDLNISKVFSTSTRSNYAQIFHFDRAGTVFLESILFNKLNYKENIYHCIPFGSSNKNYGRVGKIEELKESIKKNSPDIFINYRKDWWGWLTSVYLSDCFGTEHYDSGRNWNELDPIFLSEMALEHLSLGSKYQWNALCSSRIVWPHLNFYIIEFSDLIKHQNLSDHKQIPYDKRKLISNYDEAKNIFEEKYLPGIRIYEKRCINHLKEMKCQEIFNFNFLLDNQNL